MEHAVVLLGPGVEIKADEIPFIEDGSPMPGGDSGFSFRSLTGNEDYHTARDRVLAEFEKAYLSKVVRRAKGVMSEAARVAGVDRTTLYRLMQKHGIDRQDGPAAARQRLVLSLQCSRASARWRRDTSTTEL